MRPSGSAVGLPPFRERFFTALLPGKLSSPALAPIFVGAISSPLRVESAERQPSPLP